MNEDLLQKLANPVYEIEEAQELMRQAAVKLEQQLHWIHFLQENNERLRRQVEALILDLGIKEGHYHGNIQN